MAKRQPEKDLRKAILNHGAIPVRDPRGHVLLVGHDGTPHGYLLDATGRRLVVPASHPTARGRLADLHNELVGLHQQGTAQGLTPEGAQHLAKRRIQKTHEMINHMRRHGGTEYDKGASK